MKSFSIRIDGGNTYGEPNIMHGEMLIKIARIREKYASIAKSAIPTSGSINIHRMPSPKRTITLNGEHNGIDITLNRGRPTHIRVEERYHVWYSNPYSGIGTIINR